MPQDYSCTEYDSFVLEINKLSKTFGDFTLRDINLSLKRGYVMGFIGPNGAGKTTTIKLIMNLLRKDQGEIKVFGLDHVEHEKEIKNRIGFVYDQNYFYGVLTINAMKKLIAPLYDYWDENMFQRFLKEFNLNPKQKIDNLSKGMKTKFALAIALSHQAEFIIMDEPTSGLDPIFRNELLEILYYLIQDERRSILFSSHITSDLERIADYITLINKGEIVFSAGNDEILDKFDLVKGPLHLLDSALENSLLGMRTSSSGFEGLTADAKKIKHDYGNRVMIEKASLDDIMVYLIKKLT